ncbi:MAG: hypothetical protein S4CHLAM81_01720 [Chlamydiales bacterium]|nr:hypothetical protein [Chlamydiales bacterium]MCH9634968.1 hypothetical protein [Chlamydiales bacterium]MCH9704427.1 hypothetical protein [Chlamydiota bacterium]
MSDLTINNTAARLCAEQPKALVGGFLALEAAKTVIVALALAGVLNRTGFLIGVGGTIGLEILGLASLGKKVGICDSAKYALIASLIIFAIPAGSWVSVLCGKGLGGPSWTILSMSMLIPSSYLILKGFQKKFESENQIKFRLC